MTCNINNSRKKTFQNQFKYKINRPNFNDETFFLTEQQSQSETINKKLGWYSYVYVYFNHIELF